MSSLLLRVCSLEETIQLGHILADLLREGDVVALIGNLGAGKTHLAQAIAMAFGVPREEVTSPTFVLIQEYQGSLTLCHIDAYRLKDVDEFLELGADELLGADNICLIEWADRVEEVLPRRRIEVQIETVSEEQRQITIRCPSSRIDDFHKKLSGAFESNRCDG